MIDEYLKRKDECTGCHACMSICLHNAIVMEADEEGFLYPVVNKQMCIRCKRCIETCPCIKMFKTDNRASAYACMNNDEKVRLKSSSGGIFTLLAEQTVSENGVVFGAAFSEKFEVRHCGVDDLNRLNELQGAKYVQSRIGETLTQAKNTLDAGNSVMFVGTPCQIAGLIAYLNKPYDKLLCVDVICHGVPSPKVWMKYVEHRKKTDKAEVNGIAFRSKKFGWRKYAMVFDYNNNIQYCRKYNNDLFMKAFLRNICLRPSCYECKLKTLNRLSDVTLADFWGIHNVLPGMDDDKGTSLVLINSKKGKNAFDGVSGKLKSREVNVNEAVKYNSAAVRSVKAHPNRDYFLNDIDYDQFDVVVKRYCKDKLLYLLKKKVMAMIRTKKVLQYVSRMYHWLKH